MPPSGADLKGQPAPPPSPPATAIEVFTRKGYAKAAKEAGLEYTRMGLNLPELTGDQKSRLRAALEKNTRRPS